MGSRLAVLSIQSRVAAGAVGNGVALPALAMRGRTAWGLDTTAWSNHPGNGRPGGLVRPAEELDAQLNGLERNGFLGQVEAVLSGYLGGPRTAEVVASAADRVRAALPGAPYACDPVMGDAEKGIYVAPEIPAAIRGALLPRADLVLPNAFELGLLAGEGVQRALEPVADLVARAGRVRATMRAGGPCLVLVKSVAPAGAEGPLGALLLDPAGAHLCTLPRLPAGFHGSGDLFAALFLAAWLEGGDPVAALGVAVAQAHAALKASLAVAPPAPGAKAGLDLPAVLRTLARAVPGAAIERVN